MSNWRNCEIVGWNDADDFDIGRVLFATLDELNGSIHICEIVNCLDRVGSSIAFASDIIWPARLTNSTIDSLSNI